MKKVLLAALMLASVTVFSCSDDDAPKEICVECEASGTTMEQCGTEAEIAQTEKAFTDAGGTCTRK